MKKNDFLACPMDGLKLVTDGKSVRCDKGHCFDVDRRGALNLLPVQFKNSKSPGDSREMVAARHHFLEAGFYEPILNALNETLDEVGAKSVLDAGCGGGYYASRLLANVPRVIGMDISKDAITLASKRDADVTWVVGTNNHIPVLAGSLDAVICMFGFPVFNEFIRVVKPGGTIIMVDPGPEHLIELRRVLYAEVKSNEPANDVHAGLVLRDMYRVTAPFDGLSVETVESILVMTPHGYRAAADRKIAALETDFPEMTLDVIFRIYKVLPAKL